MNGSGVDDDLYTEQPSRTVYGGRGWHLMSGLHKKDDLATLGFDSEEDEKENRTVSHIKLDFSTLSISKESDESSSTSGKHEKNEEGHISVGTLTPLEQQDEAGTTVKEIDGVNGTSVRDNVTSEHQQREEFPHNITIVLEAKDLPILTTSGSASANLPSLNDSSQNDSSIAVSDGKDSVQSQAEKPDHEGGKDSVQASNNTTENLKPGIESSKSRNSSIHDTQDVTLTDINVKTEDLANTSSIIDENQSVASLSSEKNVVGFKSDSTVHNNPMISAATDDDNHATDTEIEKSDKTSDEDHSHSKSYKDTEDQKSEKDASLSDTDQNIAIILQSTDSVNTTTSNKTSGFNNVGGSGGVVDENDADVLERIGGSVPSFTSSIRESDGGNVTVSLKPSDRPSVHFHLGNVSVPGELSGQPSITSSFSEDDDKGNITIVLNDKEGKNKKKEGVKGNNENIENKENTGENTGNGENSEHGDNVVDSSKSVTGQADEIKDNVTIILDMKTLSVVKEGGQVTKDVANQTADKESSATPSDATDEKGFAKTSDTNNENNDEESSVKPSDINNHDERNSEKPSNIGNQNNDEGEPNQSIEKSYESSDDDDDDDNITSTNRGAKGHMGGHSNTMNEEDHKAIFHSHKAVLQKQNKQQQQ